MGRNVRVDNEARQTKDALIMYLNGYIKITKQKEERVKKWLEETNKVLEATKFNNYPLLEPLQATQNAVTVMILGYSIKDKELLRIRNKIYKREFMDNSDSLILNPTPYLETAKQIKREILRCWEPVECRCEELFNCMNLVINLLLEEDEKDEFMMLCNSISVTRCFRSFMPIPLLQGEDSNIIFEDAFKEFKNGNTIKSLILSAQNISDLFNDVHDADKLKIKLFGIKI